MMIWAIACLSFGAKQYELYGKISDSMVVSVVLQVIIYFVNARTSM